MSAGPEARNIQVGDIWKWVPSSTSWVGPEHWLISGYNEGSDSWFGIYLDGPESDGVEYSGMEEITVNEEHQNWIKVA